jgi:DNA-binding CsgD family transcriptional regulator/PAS domain-containing protein
VSRVREDERLSELIGDIYDAALDPSLWVDVLDRAARFVGGPAASLYSRDAPSRGASATYHFGLDPRYVQLYLETYAKLDPTFPGYFFAEIEQPVDVTDIMPYDEYLETRFHKEWARPQGWVDSVNVVLEKSATAAAMFVVFRHERDGIVDDATRARMRLIAPHFRRAVVIGKTLDLKAVEAAALADTLDGLSAGMVLVNSAGRIVHANAAGHAMLRETDVLRAPSGRLIVNDPQVDQTLADIFASAGNGDAAIGIKGIALPLTARTGERYVGHVLPLTSGARRSAGTSYRAVVALFVHKAALDAPSPPEAIAKSYALTPTELRVLLAIVEVGGVPEVSEALGIAETTVKTHLGRLYEKTGTRRQADLVKIVAGFSNSLVR